MQSQSQPQNTEQNKQPNSDRILILPTRKIPTQLTDLILNPKDIECRFINGYRNVLLQEQNTEQLFWALKSDSNYCGQGFCHLLKQSLKEQEIVGQRSFYVVKSVSDQMFVAEMKPQDNKELKEIKPIGQDKLKDLVSQVQEIGKDVKLPVNLVKNSFENFEQYNKIAGQSMRKLQEILRLQEQKFHQIPSVAQKLTQEKIVKRLQGDSVREVPKCDLKSGDWNDAQSIQIKLAQQK